ncbi:MAG: DUF4367 domain-containing protein [Defluviitaleaceae bacterium]|nr:DUF4367 domain-containing protein [Defluviitaleaceae bacterium]
MSIKTNTDRNEILFETMLKIAFEEVVEEEMAALPSLEELEESCPRSPRLEKRLMKIVKEEEREGNREKLSKFLIRSAAAITAFIIVTGVVVVSVEASRTFLFNTFIDVRNDHMAFEIGQPGSEVVNNISNDTILALLPEWFEYAGSHVSNTSSLSLFANPNGEEIIFMQSADIPISISADNENRDFRNQYINNIEIFIFEAFDYTYTNIVMWISGNSVFHLSASFEIDINILVDTVTQLLK